MGMETRAIVAVVLSAALLIIYQMFLVPPSPAPAPAPAPPPETARATAPEPPRPARTEAARPPRAAKIVSKPPQRTAAVETPLYRAVVSSEGGKLQEWTLHYRGEKPLVAVGELGPRGLVLWREGLPPEPVAFRLTREAIALDDKHREDELVMTGEDAYGVRVAQTARFRSDDYTMALTVRLENTRSTPQRVTVALPLVAPTKPRNGSTQWPTELVWQSNATVERLQGLTGELPKPTPGEWIGLGNLYYLSALSAKGPGFTLAFARVGEDRIEAALRGEVTLAPGQVWEARAEMYAGPKEYERLEAHGLRGAINFGGFPIPRSWGGLPADWLGLPVLWVMKLFYRYIGNWGVAIILLTVVTKVLFYPLSVKSMTSMKKMQAIQPQVNAIRAKHRSDPQRVQRETLELYRREGVNPVGGCLPMIVQIPIFYALYLALSVSVELQNAPFICIGRLFGFDLWICDLATQDPIYVLPILMGVTMFVQQKMTPVMSDPRQAKMMLFMPVVFTFMFLNLPSGLVLYWTVSNVLQILQQYLMNRTPARVAGREAKDVARA
jgi:YidC/Oxa1 family membrane protein insertase